jgi:hypothetical protein
MFNLDVDDRLAAWSNLRKQVNQSREPLLDIANFWKDPPFVGHNPNIDPYYQASWPTPWEIVVENKYDDFTRAIMIGYTILLTDRFKDSEVQIQTLVDEEGKKLYNIVYVDNTWALNYQDGEVVSVNNIPSLYRLENLVELKRPR